jgi:hypothetical protein
LYTRSDVEAQRTPRSRDASASLLSSHAAGFVGLTALPRYRRSAPWRSDLRGIAGRAVLSTTIVSTTIMAACTLGVVDLPPQPAPAELRVTSELGADPQDPSRVQVLVTAALDPGIGLDGEARRVLSDVMGIHGVSYSPSEPRDPSRPTWLASESYETPGPYGVQLRLPRLEGLGFGEVINMRVRVDVTPEGTIVLQDGEDLVLTTEPPSNPAQELEWSMALSSESTPSFRILLEGEESWPAEVRVPADQIPGYAFPLRAEMRIQWDRSLDLFELTPDERYRLWLRSIMEVGWSVEAGG